MDALKCPVCMDLPAPLVLLNPCGCLLCGSCILALKKHHGSQTDNVRDTGFRCPNCRALTTTCTANAQILEVIRTHYTEECQWTADRQFMTVYNDSAPPTRLERVRIELLRDQMIEDESSDDLPPLEDSDELQDIPSAQSQLMDNATPVTPLDYSSFYPSILSSSGQLDEETLRVLIRDIRRTVIQPRAVRIGSFGTSVHRDAESGS